MKNWTDLQIPILLFGLTVFFCAAARPADEHEADRFFKSFTQSRDKIIALEAPFTQTVITPDETIEVRGTLSYIRPRRVIYRMEDPERITLVDDTRGYEYDAEIRQVTVFDLGNNPQAEILFMGFVDTLDTLRQAYDLEIFKVPDEPRGSKGLEIRPKAGSEAESYFLRVRLYLRDQDFLPWRILIRNDENTETHIDIGEINTAWRPAPASTQIFLPEGTKMIENDRVVEVIGPGGKRIPDALLLPPEGSGTAASPLSTPKSETAPEAAPPTPVPEVAPEKPTPAASPTPASEPTRPESTASSSPAVGQPPADQKRLSEPAAPTRNPKQIGGPKRKTP